MSGRSIFVLVLMGCAGLAQAQSPRVDRAWELLARGERDQAVRLLRQIIAADPRDADARLLLGSVLADGGQFQESIAQFEEAVRLRPRSAEAHHALGEALSKLGDGAAGRREFETAVALDPEFAQARIELSRVLLEAGDYTTAGEHLDRAISIFRGKPDSAYARYLRAKVYTERNEAAKAAADLQVAVSLQPDLAEAWSDLGQARKALLDDAGALAALEQAVKLNPNGHVGRYRLGSEYLRQGNARRAIVHLEEAFRLQPEDQSTLYSLQLALRADGRIERARAVKERLTEVLRAIDTESRNAFTALRLNNEGAELEKGGNMPEAAKKYRTAVALDPNHVGIRVNLAVALLRLGEWREGLSELREAQRRDPGNASAKAALADALEQAPVEFGGKGKSLAAPR